MQDINKLIALFPEDGAFIRLLYNSPSNSRYDLTIGHVKNSYPDLTRKELENKIVYLIHKMLSNGLDKEYILNMLKFKYEDYNCACHDLGLNANN
jgi:hypothetical protein